MMSTPSTADVRAWAQGNGFEVGERGRLPDEVHAAYRNAHARAGSRANSDPRVRKATKTTRPATPPARTVTAQRSATTAATSPARPTTNTDTISIAAARQAEAQPTDGDLAARVTRLEAQVTELTARLDKAAQAPTKARPFARRGK